MNIKVYTNAYGAPCADKTDCMMCQHFGGVRRPKWESALEQFTVNSVTFADAEFPHVCVINVRRRRPIRRLKFSGDVIAVILFAWSLLKVHKKKKMGVFFS